MPEFEKTHAKSARRVIGVCVLLASLVFIVFGQTIRFDFVNFDDSAYVYENPVILRGLSISGIGWAFTHSLAGHWHPLTVIVLMLEHRVFGLWAGGYHMVNVLLHALSAVFLFLLLIEMTGAFWRSAFVAAVFAVHPLRAESVAWVSECKDVLSGVFFMLTLWSYVLYARRRSRRRSYALALVWFALGLMSKPMLVTLPCVLLLLDYWPLRRLQKLAEFPALLWEKLPFFVLSALSSVAAMLALKSGEAPVSSYPANAPVAYSVYLEKLLYPAHLAPMYPIPVQGWPAWVVLNAILLLAVLTTAAWLLRRNQPYLLMGWLWYLGMLVPVIGLMQTGNDAYADRYTYLTQIGLCIAITWAVADWTQGWRFRRYVLAGAAMIILCVLSVACSRQIAWWRDGMMLWTRTLECTRDNFVAHQCLGDVLYRAGREQEAIAQFREAERINPIYADAHDGLGGALLQLGRTDEAAAEYREASRLDPADPQIHCNYGNALLRQGRFDEAVEQLRTALRLDPACFRAYNSLGSIALRQGHIEEAVTDFRKAIQINPEYEDAHYNSAGALTRQGQIDEAVAEYREALRINPHDADALHYLNDALSKQGH